MSLIVGRQKNYSGSLLSLGVILSLGKYQLTYFDTIYTTTIVNITSSTARGFSVFCFNSFDETPFMFFSCDGAPFVLIGMMELRFVSIIAGAFCISWLDRALCSLDGTMPLFCWWACFGCFGMVEFD